MRLLLTYLFIAITLLSAKLSYAQVSLSGGNLGYTSFMDGVGFPGIISDQYFYYNHADDFTDADGDKLPGKNKMHNLMLLSSFKICFENPAIPGRPINY
jgi:hypothetical protein